MTLPIEYADGVREDMDLAYAWYEDQQPGLGERFLLAIADVVAKIQAHPRRLDATNLITAVRECATA